MWFTFGEILSNIVKTMKTGKNASFRNVVERHRSVTLFSFLDVQIAWLQTVGRDGTAQNYQRARNSFSLYRCGRDIPLRSVTSELICDYESWLKRRSVTRNTVSFYMRILRSVYNKAVERGLVSPSTPFKYVYTGIEKTRKRAVDEGTVVRLQQLDLSGRPSLCFARDLFLFSFYCRGMAFVDLCPPENRAIAAYPGGGMHAADYCAVCATGLLGIPVPDYWLFGSGPCVS